MRFALTLFLSAVAAELIVAYWQRHFPTLNHRAFAVGSYITVSPSWGFLLLCGMATVAIFLLNRKA